MIGGARAWLGRPVADDLRRADFWASDGTNVAPMDAGDAVVAGRVSSNTGRPSLALLLMYTICLIEVVVIGGWMIAHQVGVVELNLIAAWEAGRERVLPGHADPMINLVVWGLLIPPLVALMLRRRARRAA